MEKIRVTVWNEYIHENRFAEIRKIYPEGIHGCISNFLNEAGINATTATLDMNEHGLSDEVLANTDVLIWWGHMAHEQVDDKIVEKVYMRVMEGMGLVVLHSGHGSKIFSKICGCETGRLKWREDGKTEVLWVVDPSHPIAEGLAEKIIIPQEEMYGEYFWVPQPDSLVFISWFEGGEVFRSGLCYHRGKGKILYFRPGHEAFPVYYMPEIQKIITNAVKWACSQDAPVLTYGNTEPVIESTGKSDFIGIQGLHEAKEK